MDDLRSSTGKRTWAGFSIRPFPAGLKIRPTDRPTTRMAPRRAAAAVELALLLPLLALLLVISVDFARLYYHYMTITNCARNGAMWLCDPVAQSFSKYATVDAAARADATNLDPSRLAVFSKSG